MSSDPTWYKDAVIYEIRLRSFFDSDADGIGDFAGLTEKLDYLVDLGVTALWLLPFYVSPLKDDGYDTADYREVHPTLGNLKDFKRFMKAAHQRGLRVITELVLNHTSDQHAWFQRARRAPTGSRERDYYVWSDDPSRYAQARIIFKDFEVSNWTWDPVAKAYYWHRFFSNQPDLNYQSPDVQKAMLEVVDFWLGMGVDGLRLDAVPYLFEKEGTNCENLPETHDFLRTLRRHIDRKHQDKMLLAEANQWPEDAARYFGGGDECHMCFHFPIMPRLFMALRMEDHYPILDILEQTPEIPETCQWAIFLRNHDELTLEMVTDEERDYMVDAYASERSARINLGIRRRLAPLLENNRRRIELMNALLFSLPGTPVVYYGDELGMGDNVYLGDRNGVRTPMQWSGDKNAGFSRANPQKLVLPPIQDPEYHFATVNVEAQQQNTSSLLWWTKRLIALRKQYACFGRGSFEPIFCDNRRVLAFLRRLGDEVVMVVANLSRFAQYVELELDEFSGIRPREIFGNTEFPEIGGLPYLVTLGPHDFLWFVLRRAPDGKSAEPPPKIPSVTLAGAWDDVFEGRAATTLCQVLRQRLPSFRWFRGKTRNIQQVRLLDALTLDATRRLAVISVAFSEGDPQRYAVFLGFCEGSRLDNALLDVTVKGKQQHGQVVECSGDAEVARALLNTLITGKPLRGGLARVVSRQMPALKALSQAERPVPRALGREQTNTSYVFGEQVVGKVYRLLEQERSVELEVLEHLTSPSAEASVPRLLGHLELEVADQKGITLGIFQELVRNHGDAWALALDEVSRFYDQVLALRPALEGAAPQGALVTSLAQMPRDEIRGLIGPFWQSMELLGRRTAELHRALMRPSDDGTFRAEPFEALSKRSFYQSLRNLSARVTDQLKAQAGSLSGEAHEQCMLMLGRKRELQERLKRIRDNDLLGLRIRVHGDFHLGQVLSTGRDFTIIDFEGEPARSRSHRRALRSPIADIAGLIRSLSYAAQVPLRDEARSHLRAVDQGNLGQWAGVWQRWSSRAYLGGYLSAIAEAELVPEDSAALGLLLDAYVLEKALYEVVYELDNRPGWVSIPLAGILALLRD